VLPPLVGDPSAAVATSTSRGPVGPTSSATTGAHAGLGRAAATRRLDGRIASFILSNFRPRVLDSRFPRHPPPSCAPHTPLRCPTGRELGRSWLILCVCDPGVTSQLAVASGHSAMWPASSCDEGIAPRPPRHPPRRATHWFRDLQHPRILPANGGRAAPRGSSAYARLPVSADRTDARPLLRLARHCHDVPLEALRARSSVAGRSGPALGYPQPRADRATGSRVRRRARSERYPCRRRAGRDSAWRPVVSLRRPRFPPRGRASVMALQGRAPPASATPTSGSRRRYGRRRRLPRLASTWAIVKRVVVSSPR